MIDRTTFLNKLKEASNPDKAAEVLATLIDEVNGLYDSIDSSAAAKTEYESKIADLRDTNQRLFLRVADGVTDNTDDTSEEEETPEQALNKILTLWKGETK